MGRELARRRRFEGEPAPVLLPVTSARHLDLGVVHQILRRERGGELVEAPELARLDLLEQRPGFVQSLVRLDEDGHVADQGVQHHATIIREATALHDCHRLTPGGVDVLDQNGGIWVGVGELGQDFHLNLLRRACRLVGIACLTIAREYNKTPHLSRQTRRFVIVDLYFFWLFLAFLKLFRLLIQNLL